MKKHIVKYIVKETTSEHFGTLHIYCAKHKEFKMNADICRPNDVFNAVCLFVCLFGGWLVVGLGTD